MFVSPGDLMLLSRVLNTMKAGQKFLWSKGRQGDHMVKEFRTVLKRVRGGTQGGLRHDGNGNKNNGPEKNVVLCKLIIDMVQSAPL